MANLDQISPEIISKIARVIGSKLKSLGDVSREAYGGVRAVSEMFNRLDSSTSKEILESIDQKRCAYDRQQGRSSQTENDVSPGKSGAPPQ